MQTWLLRSWKKNHFVAPPILHQPIGAVGCSLFGLLLNQILTHKILLHNELFFFLFFTAHETVKSVVGVQQVNYTIIFGSFILFNISRTVFELCQKVTTNDRSFEYFYLIFCLSSVQRESSCAIVVYYIWLYLTSWRNEYSRYVVYCFFKLT